MLTKIYPVMWIVVTIPSAKTKAAKIPEGGQKKGFTLSFPVPLSVLGELLDCTLDLLQLFRLFPHRKILEDQNTNSNAFNITINTGNSNKSSSSDVSSKGYPATKNASPQMKHHLPPEALNVILLSTRTLLKSLTENGPFTLVEVTTEKVRVLIKIL